MIRTLSALSAAALFAGISHAQTSDTADAAANLEQAQPALTVQVTSNMNFRDVAIPYDPATTCRYDLSALGPISDFDVSGDGAASQVFGGDSVAGCGSQGTGFPARFEIGCGSLELVNYDVSYQSAGLPGVEFLSPENGSDTLVRLTVAGEPDERTASSGSFSCTGVASAFAGIAGRLEVSSDAAPGADVQVGSISLSVNY